MAIARVLDRKCLALWASGLRLRYTALQNLIPSFPWITPPRPPPWRNPRKGRDQILPSGKHSREDGEVQKGRFHKNKNYSDRFYKPDVFDALDTINAACNEADISIIQVCPLPWQVQLMTH